MRVFAAVLLALAAGIATVQSLSVNCTGTASAYSYYNGLALKVFITNDLPYDVDLCWFDWSGMTKQITQIKKGEVDRWVTTWNNHAFALRESVPFMPCKGPTITTGAFVWTASESTKLSEYVNVCYVTFPRRILRGWNQPARFKGVQGEFVEWNDVLTARDKPYSQWKRFYNRNGAERLFKNIPDTTELWEVRVPNSRGIDTTRLICSFKGERATFRGVISHTTGLSNNFAIAETLPAEEVVAAVGTGAAAEGAAAEAVGEAVVATGDAVAVGETVSSLTAAAAEGSIVTEVIEVVAALLLI